jgi:hypothetical protein
LKSGVHDDVRHVAMDEQLARVEVDDLVGRHAAVRAADPQVARRLLREETPEEVRLAGDHVGGPFAVAVEEVADGRHSGRHHTGPQE